MLAVKAWHVPCWRETTLKKWWTDSTVRSLFSCFTHRSWPIPARGLRMPFPSLSRRFTWVGLRMSCPILEGKKILQEFGKEAGLVASLQVRPKHAQPLHTAFASSSVFIAKRKRLLLRVLQRIYRTFFCRVRLFLPIQYAIIHIPPRKESSVRDQLVGYARRRANIEVMEAGGRGGHHHNPTTLKRGIHAIELPPSRRISVYRLGSDVVLQKSVRNL